MNGSQTLVCRILGRKSVRSQVRNRPIFSSYGCQSQGLTVLD